MNNPYKNYGVSDAVFAMFAIVIWATAAWYFGIPTSESHALIAGVTGGAIALYHFDKGFSIDEIKVALETINGNSWQSSLNGCVSQRCTCSRSRAMHLGRMI